MKSAAVKTYDIIAMPLILILSALAFGYSVTVSLGGCLQEQLQLQQRRQKLRKQKANERRNGICPAGFSCPLMTRARQGEPCINWSACDRNSHKTICQKRNRILLAASHKAL